MITIALPAFKGRFLHEAIRSVLSQTYDEWELIILDDASPDPIEDIVRDLWDPRFKFHRNTENIGSLDLTLVWNRCLHQADGTYFVLFSDDDRYHPHFLQDLLDLANSRPKFCLFRSPVNVIDSSGNLIERPAGIPKRESAVEFVYQRLARSRRQFAPEFFCRTSALRSIGGFISYPKAWCSDDATWFELARRGGGVCSTQSPACDWRLSEHNISGGAFLTEKWTALRLFSRWLCKQYLDTLTPETEREAEMLRELKKIAHGGLAQRQYDLLVKSRWRQIWGLLPDEWSNPIFWMGSSANLFKRIWKEN
jgi:glycosyltransferase involved in cell wall biosynthesis